MGDTINNIQNDEPRSFWTKAKEFLGLKDAPGDISDRKEHRINRAVERDIHKHIDEKVTLADTATAFFDPKEKHNPEKSDREQIIEKVFAGAPGADRLKTSEKIEIVDAAIKKTLDALQPATYASEVDYRTAVKHALDNVHIEYTYDRERQKGEDKKEYQNTKELSAQIDIDLNKLASNTVYKKDGTIKEVEPANFHQANEHGKHKVLFSVLEGAAFALGPFVGIAVVTAVQAGKKIDGLAGNNCASDDKLKGAQAKLEGVKHDKSDDNNNKNLTPVLKDAPKGLQK